jgi:hypothetical protein
MEEVTMQQEDEAPSKNMDEIKDDENDEKIEIAKPMETDGDQGEVKCTKGTTVAEEPPNGFWARQFMRMARNPWVFFWTAFSISLALSIIAIFVGNFSVNADNAGWNSRGTLISDRHTQVLLVEQNQSKSERLLIRVTVLAYFEC